MNTGIHLDDSVLGEFEKMITDKTIRWIRLSIVDKDTKVSVVETFNSTGDFNVDYSKMKDNLESKDGAYYVLRLEDGKFLFISYIPRNTKVRSKMLYSSTSKNVVNGFPSRSFVGKYHIINADDFNSFNWKKEDEIEEDEKKVMFKTERERLEDEERLSEAKFTSGSTGKTIKFPIQDDVKDAIGGLKKKKKNLVVIKIVDEKIVLDFAKSGYSGGLCDILPAKEPRFALYCYEHKFEGKKCKPLLFIYSCPTKAKIKQKMVYSATKLNLTSYVVGKKKMKFKKSIETSDVKDLTKEFIIDELHPKKYEEKVKFTKPKAPGGRRRRPKKANI